MPMCKTSNDPAQCSKIVDPLFPYCPKVAHHGCEKAQTIDQFRSRFASDKYPLILCTTSSTLLLDMQGIANRTCIQNACIESPCETLMVQRLLYPEFALESSFLLNSDRTTCECGLFTISSRLLYPQIKRWASLPGYRMKR